MKYTLNLFDSDDASPAERRDAEQRFRRALAESLGDESLVGPLYMAYQRLAATYGDEPDLDLLTEAEREIFTAWQTAELAAITAAFGPNRYMGDAMFEIRVVE